jgi:hypothetical protein
MRARLTKVTVVVMGLAALAFGGASLAGAAGKSSSSTPAVVQDQDSIQQGDQAGPEKADAAEPAGEAGSESSSESAVDSDGPGGHADEPGNPNADNQFQGEQ